MPQGIYNTSLLKQQYDPVTGAELSQKIVYDSEHKPHREIVRKSQITQEEIDKGDARVYYDYEGIEKWCTGAWKANKSGTKAYREYYRKISGQLKISFHKVRGHSGDTYNEMADKLAKKALKGEGTEGWEEEA